MYLCRNHLQTSTSLKHNKKKTIYHNSVSVSSVVSSGRQIFNYYLCRHISRRLLNFLSIYYLSNRKLQSSSLGVHWLRAWCFCWRLSHQHSTVATPANVYFLSMIWRSRLRDSRSNPCLITFHVIHFQNTILYGCFTGRLWIELYLYWWFNFEAIIEVIFHSYMTGSVLFYAPV